MRTYDAHSCHVYQWVSHEFASTPVGVWLCYEYKVETNAAWIWVRLLQVFGTSYSQFDFRARYQTSKGGSRISLGMCIWNTDAIVGNKVQLWKVINFDSALRACDVSELWATLRWTNSPMTTQTSNTWGGTELRTDILPNGRTIQSIDVPGIPFRPGA